MSITRQAKEKVIKKFQKHDSDVGSAEIQIAVITERIRNLTEHFKSHKKDFHSRRGLLQMVGRRKRLLEYLHKNDYNSYKNVIGSLKLRK
ncbi:MAG: 30S ribosomal protein S15 [Candidatus Glassbacteria bacterium]|nr:30S ribosomal protein S15 [Candidatus Glassbacteria bacterium]